MNRRSLPGNRLLLGSLLLSALGASSALTADVIDVGFDEPTLDRWFYPFNVNPGFKTVASVFGALTDQGFDPNFDNRDGQMLIGFDTSTVVPAGLGAASYDVTSATVSITIESHLTFAYDPSPDPYQSWLQPGDPDYVEDPDDGRPVELFGAGFRCDYTASTFPEDGPYCDGCNCFPPNSCVAVRCVYPIDFAAGCRPRDVSNNVWDEFDPIPFAVGTNDGLAQGQSVPFDTVLTFEIDTGDPCVQGYLRDALDEGMLDLLVASIFPAAQQQEGTFPKFYTKENLAVTKKFVDAAQLLMTVVTIPLEGDINGDGVVNVTDLLILLGAWGPCPEPCPPACTADIDGDCLVGVSDLLAVLAAF